MKRQQVTFFLAGLIAGLICIILGSLESLVAILTLTYGVGPLFFLAVVVGILITRAWRNVRAGIVHYLAGLVLCTITYFVALVAFFWVAGFSQRWVTFGQSENIVNFGIDVWLGLVAAGAVGSIGIALFTALLTGRWSKTLLVRLMLAGLLTIIVTFIAKLSFQTDWSFLGVLFPLGNALFCYLVGTQIWQHSESGRQIAATAGEPHQRPA